MGIVLTELLLGSGNQAVIMLGVLVVVLRRHRIARSVGVACKLNIFFGNVRRCSSDFHVGAVRLVDPCHRILALAVIIAPAHALVLTVSHDCPVC